METNETAFCSLWTKHIKIHDCADLFFNVDLAEDYFFNRLNPFECDDIRATIENAAQVCHGMGMACFVYAHDNDTEVHNSLTEVGFDWIDTMHVLTSEPKKQVRHLTTYDDKFKVMHVDADSVPRWVDTFCRSFNVMQWKQEVRRVVGMHLDDLDLLLSYIHEKNSFDIVTGCAALITNEGLMGLYCLGTIKQFRGQGIAKKMIDVSMNKASQQRLDMVLLQTFSSEGLLPFYTKLGFRPAYKKRVYLRK
jgi:GNAT superfamily N-acetyltransferase